MGKHNLSGVFAVIVLGLMSLTAAKRVDAAIFVGATENGNSVVDLGSSHGYTFLEVHFNNTNPVSIYLDSYGGSDDITVQVYNDAGIPWHDFTYRLTDATIYMLMGLFPQSGTITGYDITSTYAKAFLDPPEVLGIMNGRAQVNAFGVFTLNLEPGYSIGAPPVAVIAPVEAVHPGSIVNLDGTGSYDPDENYPLVFSWTLDVPGDSLASLTGADTPTPSFTPDGLGDYTATLVVTDTNGAESEPVSTVVSTFSAAPIADAGPDQALLTLGVPVQIGTAPGRQSFDPDGDEISFDWLLTPPPESSSALDDPASPVPVFTPDTYGDYLVYLVVTDVFGASSAPDEALISFENLPPVADAGGDQGVTAGETALLDGGGSSDPNGDSPLSYHWNLTSSPSTSVAALENTDQVTASLTPDRAGSYVVSLVVNDGALDSEVDTATVTATVTSSIVIDAVEEVIDVVNALPADAFKNKNRAKALTNKLSAVLKKIDSGNYSDALDKLYDDLLPKTDGCANIGEPENNDWIVTCEAQEVVYSAVLYSIGLIEDLLAQ